MWTLLCVLFVLLTGLPLIGVALSIRENPGRQVCPVAWGALATIVAVFVLAVAHLPGAVSADIADVQQRQEWFQEVRQFAADRTPVQIVDRGPSFTLCAMGEDHFFLPSRIVADDIQDGDAAIFVITRRTYRLQRP